MKETDVFTNDADGDLGAIEDDTDMQFGLVETNLLNIGPNSEVCVACSFAHMTSVIYSPSSSSVVVQAPPIKPRVNHHRTPTTPLPSAVSPS